MTHGKPCVNMHACRTHGKPCVTMLASWRMYKWEFVEEGRSRKEEKEKGKGNKGKKEKKEREREREQRERERGSKGSRRYNSRNSSDQELKDIYSMRAMLQEVGILPTLVYFPP